MFANLPEEIINKIIMKSVPTYPYLEELKNTRFIRGDCDCEGCEYKHGYGCYDFIFNSISSKRGTICNILHFNASSYSGSCECGFCNSGDVSNSDSD